LDVAAATLNALKGRPMAIDLLSILQDDKRTFSFLSQCVGLMADLDLGTEHLRWMGSNRFVYGYLRGSKCYPPVFEPSPNEANFPSLNAQGVPILNLCKERDIGKGCDGRGLTRVHKLSAPFRRPARGGTNRNGASPVTIRRRT
jgi:hypothetical protein